LITILASLLGFLGSSFPKLLGMFQDKQDKAQELAIMSVQLEMAKLNIQGQLKEINVQSNTDQMKILYQTYDSGIKWVDALNGAVRPIIAYAFFLTYLLTKTPAFLLAIHDIYHGLQITSATQYQLWSDNDSAIFAGIISFYFGSRGFMKKI
jgi:hypothetical protein